MLIQLSYRDIKALIAATDTPTDRMPYALDCICIAPGKATATDGVALLQIQRPVAAPTNPTHAAPFLINRKVFDALLKKWPRKNRYGLLAVVTHNTIALGDDQFTFRQHDGRYPDYTKVWPTAFGPLPEVLPINITDYVDPVLSALDVDGCRLYRALGPGIGADQPAIWVDPVFDADDDPDTDDPNANRQVLFMVIGCMFPDKAVIAERQQRLLALCN